MRVVSHKSLKAFYEQPGHEDAKVPLEYWYHAVENATWSNFAEMKAVDEKRPLYYYPAGYCSRKLKNGEIFSLRDRLPNVSLRKDFMSNILTVNDILSDEKSAIEYKLLIAAYNAWKKKKTIL